MPRPSSHPRTRLVEPIALPLAVPRRHHQTPHGPLRPARQDYVALARASKLRPAGASSMRSTRISSHQGVWPSGGSRSVPSPSPSVRISLVSRLRREEGGCFSQELIVLFQIEVLPPQPCQFSPLILVQRARGFPIDATPALLCFHPGAQGLLTDSDFPGHRSNRPASVNDETRSLDPILLSIRTPLALLI